MNPVELPEFTRLPPDKDLDKLPVCVVCGDKNYRHDAKAFPVMGSERVMNVLTACCNVCYTHYTIDVSLMTSGIDVSYVASLARMHQANEKRRENRRNGNA